MKTYKKQFGLFRSKAVQDEINRLDPQKDHCRIVHLLSGYEFPWDGIRALEVALMRSFCSSSVSRLLHRTGEFRRHGQKRYDDTALLIAEFMQYGYDSERGRAAIDHMNRIHSAYAISNEDYLFVLSTFILEPISWINRYGWRKPSENEKQALFYFFREVGIRMGLRDIPTSLDAFEQFAALYEDRNFAYTETNKHVGDATVKIVKGWMPFFAKPFVFPVLRCFLDAKMLAALGYPPPSPRLSVMVNAAMRVRARVLRYISFMPYPFFFTTQPNRSYPEGYSIEKLGPTKLLQNLKNGGRSKGTSQNPEF
ncbi:MAG TPA: oxygenase MpaB family protein [Flavisolibacter sp.]|jgi:hypothetical protein|nr:oxygenase MpaB family protein [Flavisolibacter sp.]